MHPSKRSIAKVGRGGWPTVLMRGDWRAGDTRHGIKARKSYPVTPKTISTTTDIQGDYTITVSVDDNARAQEALIEGTSVIKISAGARGGGNARPTFKEWRADIRWKQSVHDPISPLGQAHWRFSSAEAAEHEGVLLSAIVALDEARSLAKAAEEQWRRGACIEVTSNPKEKSLRFGGRTTFRIDVKHKRDGSNSFPYPVRMMAKKEYSYIDQTLGKLEPQATLTAPASFQYTAPVKGTPEAQEWRNHPAIDRVYPMSISRRGIGLKPVYVLYDSLRRTFHVTYNHLRETEKQGLAQQVTFRAVLRELDEPNEDGDAFVGSGDYTLVARLWKANCHSYAPEELEVVQGGGTVRARGSISSEGPEGLSLIFQLEPTSGPKMRFFTKSFSLVEQQVRKETSGGNDEDVPFMASQAVGLVNIRGKSGDTTKVKVTGESECEGEKTMKTAARVRRLR